MKFTFPDEILKEVWAAKDRIGARYKGNIRKFLADLHKHQAQSPLRVVRPKVARKPRKSA